MPRARRPAPRTTRPTIARTPNFKLPSKPPPTQPIVQADPEKEALALGERTAQAKKLFADARGSVAVDENGNPVRRYLSDPPPDYRVPDPTAPVEVDNKPAVKKKWKWPWQ